MKYEYWLQQQNAFGIGPKKRRMLKAFFGSAEEIYRQPKEVLIKAAESLPGIGAATVEKMVLHRDKWRLDEKYADLSGRNICFVTEDMPEFPEHLKEIPDGPDALFYKGRLPVAAVQSAAIVGARACTAYGRTVAEELAKQLSLCGIDIISGMAYGIDGYAQQGALDAGGRTFAVLGCGPEICYPQAHIQLYMDIQRKGGILSEYPPGTPPKAMFFPLRNRIISGLADFVIVVEAKKKSGSLITADYALEQGKDVYAVPGRIEDINSRGCNRLIAQGAGIISSWEDLKEELEISGHLCAAQNVKNSENEKIPLATEEEKVYSCFNLQSKGLEIIASDAQMSVSETLCALLSLQMKGFVRETGKTHYCRTKGSLNG